MSKFVLYGILIAGFYYVYKNILKGKQPVMNAIDTSVSFDTNSKNLTPNETALFTHWNNLITSIINQYNLSLNVEMVLAVINKESGLQSLSKSNSSVIGDNGNSFGFMQVSAGALKDVNNKFGTTYTIFDLINDENVNVTVGTLYLSLGYDGSNIALAFKRYNGGLGQTIDSLNAMASAYAKDAYQKFLSFLG